jgi:branched-chain amino acid aminotransferase
MKKISQVYYVNGKFLPAKKAVINVMDIGLLRGFGVFDFIVTYNNHPFLINEHIDRLFKSASLINLNIGKTKEEIKKIIKSTLKKNVWPEEKTIRVVITGGIGNSSTEPSPKTTLIIIIEPKHNYPQSYYENGISVITYDYVRPLALSKSLDYSIAIKSLGLSRKKGGVEAIYIDKKNKTVSEATTSNLFLIKNGKIFTSDTDVLNGVTRDLIIKLLKKTYPVKKQEIELSKLISADEVFITASNKEVMPVVVIDNRKVGKGKVGPITKDVISIFRNYVNSRKW